MRWCPASTRRKGSWSRAHRVPAAVHRAVRARRQPPSSAALPKASSRPYVTGVTRGSLSEYSPCAAGVRCERSSALGTAHLVRVRGRD